MTLNQALRQARLDTHAVIGTFFAGAYYYSNKEAVAARNIQVICKAVSLLTDADRGLIRLYADQAIVEGHTTQRDAANRVYDHILSYMCDRNDQDE